MADFFESRAGKQFVALVVIGIVLWFLALHIDLGSRIHHAFDATRPEISSRMILALTLGCALSVAYSVFRLFDLRREMRIGAEAQMTADWAATHDQLTRLPNRYALERRYGQAPRLDERDQPRPVAVFCIDLDGFKKVNDLLGHAAGDQLLMEVSRRLLSISDDDAVYRIGGDEFVVMAEGVRGETAARIAAMIIKTIGRPMRIGGASVQVGGSVGFSLFGEGPATLEETVVHADLAMYEAKKGGQNRAVLYTAAIQNKANERAAIEAKLRGAVVAGEIHPHYQPLIDLRTGMICGFEALARWTDAEGRAIPPSCFIPIAEETCLISKLFEDLLQKACEDAGRWPGEITLSFNLSPTQMEDWRVAGRILSILKRAGLPPRRLEIEITENALMQEPETAARVLAELQAAGVQIALDDFGTGYSSLSQLARYRFDKIKIDRSFVASCREDPRQETIILAMLALGRSLNIKTTAEGIETEDQLSYLVGHGCDIGQGYLFGKAMPALQTMTEISGQMDRAQERSGALVLRSAAASGR